VRRCRCHGFRAGGRNFCRRIDVFGKLRERPDDQRQQSKAAEQQEPEAVHRCAAMGFRDRRPHEIDPQRYDTGAERHDNTKDGFRRDLLRSWHCYSFRRGAPIGRMPGQAGSTAACVGNGLSLHDFTAPAVSPPTM
jgi:hypothetical protein